MFIFYKHSKKKYNDQELTKYLFNVCGSSFHAVFCLRIVPCTGCTMGPQSCAQEACTSAETVQFLRSQNP